MLVGRVRPSLWSKTLRCGSGTETHLFRMIGAGTGTRWSFNLSRSKIGCYVSLHFVQFSVCGKGCDRQGSQASRVGTRLGAE